VRITGILSSSGPVSIKGNNRNGQHRLKTELQESSDSADNQNTGIFPSIQRNEGLDKYINVSMSAAGEHHRGDEITHMM